MDDLRAKEISDEVQDDYNRIAEEFSNHRRGLTADILEFAKFINRGDRILDVGCGNGRLNELISEKGALYHGVDNSAGMIAMAQKLHPQANFSLIQDSILPFEDETFDKIFSLAVIHHIPSEKLRIDFLLQIKRVLKKDGLLILTAWDLKNDKFEKVAGGDKNDIYYDFKNSTGKVLAKRYIHIFTQNELRQLAESCGFKILKFYQNSRGSKKVNHNLVLITQK